MAFHASQIYARNVTDLLQHLTKDGELKLDFEDEITRGCCVTHAGQVVNERARQRRERPPLLRPLGGDTLMNEHLIVLFTTSCWRSSSASR